MVERRQVERWIGAVLAPEVRVAGTWPGVPETVPSREYLERFPPAMVVAFGRTPSGAVSPTKLLQRVRATCRELGHLEPIVACDLEQGAGLHFAEGTRLPPALALASAALSEGPARVAGEVLLDELQSAPSLAGLITGLEARELGVHVVLAPVCDVNTRHDNPIIAVRSFGDDPHAAAGRALDFQRALKAGAAACAKHYPGHGDTAQDSHVELPRVDADAPRLRAVELEPFRRLIEGDVDGGLDAVETVMVAHLDVPALTGEPGLPCTLSQRAIADVLRGELGFHGVVLSDAMNMGALARFPERYVRALAAGCDALLCPHDATEAAMELLVAAESGRLDLEQLRTAAERVHGLRDRPMAHPKRVDLDAAQSLARMFGPLLADRALRCSPTPWPWPRDGRCNVLDPLPPSATPEIVAGIERLRAACAGPGDSARMLLPIVCELRAGSGRYGLGQGELALLERRVAEAARGPTPLALAWFGSPQTLPERLWHDPRVAIVLAFAPTPPMFAAVARYLAGGEIGRGSLPARLG